jgi:hypothetical protein
MTTVDATVPVPSAAVEPAHVLASARPVEPSAAAVVAAGVEGVPLDPEAGLARAYAVGSLAGFLGVGLVCGGIAVLGGVEPGAALGAAAFAGFWGGPGFGGTLAGVLHLERRHTGNET